MLRDGAATRGRKGLSRPATPSARTKRAVKLLFIKFGGGPFGALDPIGDAGALRGGAVPILGAAPTSRNACEATGGRKSTLPQKIALACL